MYDVNTECVNTIGSHSCSCKAGFTGNGKKCVGKFVKWLSLLPVVIHFKTKQNQNNPGLIWTLGWKLLYDRLELSPKQCHVQLHMRRDAFANNSHFRSTLALKFKPFSFYAFFQMSTNVPINRMTVTSMPTATIPLVPIDAPAIPGTKETEQAAIFVSLTNIEIQVTSVCYDTRISHSLSFCIVIWSLQFWKYIFLTWVGPESRPRWNSS